MSFLSKLKSLFCKKKRDSEMTEEMQGHLEMLTEENMARGMSPKEARDAARREFGGVEQIKEHARDQRTFVWLEQLSQDFHYAWRQLGRDPGFVLVVVCTLALGTGATTAVFSLVNGLLLKPLPYDQPGQLVQVWEAPAVGQRNVVSSGVYMDWRGQATTFESLSAFSDISLNLTGVGEPQRLSGLRMTADGLRLLGARPILGRIFATDEDQPGKEHVIVLTDELWRRSFQADPGVVGQTVLLNEQKFTIIGVLAPGFLPLPTSQFVVPYVFPPEWKEMRGGHFLRVYGRLKPGVTVQQANAELAAIAERSRALYPSWKADWSATVVPLSEQLSEGVKPALMVLLAAVAVVLLVVCANVANLLLAKASARCKEIAVRAALGASRGRIIRQLLAESLLLSGLGGAFGLGVAYWSVSVLRYYAGTMNLARGHEVAVDARVLVVSMAVALLTALLFGLAPALQGSRFVLNHALKEGGRGSATGGNRLRHGLIVGEVALALVLLVGAGLLLRSFYRLVNVSPGFEPERALTLQLSLPEINFPTAAKRVAFFNEMIAQLEALPGVESAAVAQSLPLGSSIPDNFFRIAGRETIPGPGYSADFDLCTPHYFRAMTIPLRRGRPFEERDATARVAIINEELARRFFPGEDPIGKQLMQGKQSWEIVGIVGNVRSRGLAVDIKPTIYRPQSTFDSSRNGHLIVRTTVPPLTLIEAVRRTVHQANPSQPVATMRTLESVVAGSLADRRLLLGLLSIFAGLVLVLAALGLYGVMAYAVNQRTRELGIRMALGAAPVDVLRLVLSGAIKLVAIGLLLGLAVSLSFTHLLTNLLFGVEPTDPTTFAAVSGLLLVAAVIATLQPARRATQVDPMVALRCD